MTQHNKPAPRRGPAPTAAEDHPSLEQRPGKTKPAARPVSAIVARQIDENLKRLYHQHVEQDLPPSLQALVARLREGQPAQGRRDDDEGAV